MAAGKHPAFFLKAFSLAGYEAALEAVEGLRDAPVPVSLQTKEINVRYTAKNTLFIHF